jgi:predicted GIY-YIG superfamily endonuclease
MNRFDLAAMNPGGWFVYRARDSAGRLLYIGYSRDIQARFRGHANTAPWYPEIDDISADWYSVKYEAVTAETAAIRAERPIWNWASSPDRHARLQLEATRIDEARRSELATRRAPEAARRKKLDQQARASWRQSQIVPVLARWAEMDARAAAALAL